jgi:hypothetical protein
VTFAAGEKNMNRRDFGKLPTEDRARRISFISLFALLLAGVISSFWSGAFAQTAEFSGRVLDQNNAAVAGALRHTLLFGLELSRQSIRRHGQFADVTPIDIYQPAYISRSPPPRATFIA